MQSKSTIPPSALRMPRQTAGIDRTGGRTSAISAAGGVEADGLFTWLFGEDSDIAHTLDSIGNIALPFVPGGSLLKGIGDQIF